MHPLIQLVALPFTGLDKPAQESLSKLFRELTNEGRLLIASHHELQTVPEIFDQVLLLKREQIAFGSVAEVFNQETIDRAYNSQP